MNTILLGAAQSKHKRQRREMLMATNQANEMILECRNISLSFGAVKAITDVSFNIKKGEHFQATGKVKAPLFRLEHGEPTEGGILLAGNRPSDKAGDPFAPDRKGLFNEKGTKIDVPLAEATLIADPDLNAAVVQRFGGCRPGAHRSSAVDDMRTRPPRT